MCNRNYTPATVAEMQRVAFVAALRRKIRERQSVLNVPDRGQMAAGMDAGLELALMIIEELSPVCDNASDAATLKDYTEGMAK